MSYDEDGQEHAEEGAPQASRVTEGRKLTRAERSKANKLRRKQIEVAEIALAQIPPGFAVRDRQTGELVVGLDVAGGGGPPAFPVTELRPRTHPEEKQKLTKEGKSQEMGRPSEYTEEEGDALCAWIAGGGSLISYCRGRGRAPITVYRWLREHTELHTRYSQAHEDRADTLTDEMMEIADGAAQEATIEGVSAAKLRVETRKWIAQKLRPQKWGDKTVVQHQGAVSIRLGIPAKQPLEVIDMVDNRAVLDAPDPT